MAETYSGLENLDLSLVKTPKKYELGKQSDNFNDIKNSHPFFSFEYISLNKSDYCFNSTITSAKDLVKLLSGLQKISKNTYAILDREKLYHFHDINWDETNVKESEFYKCIYKGSKYERSITAYQVKVFEEARIFGFIYKGIFYLVMFDRGHNAYDRDRSKDKKNKKHKRGK